MATVKDINVKGFCDAVYTELSGMNKSIRAMRDDLARTYGEESELFRAYERHLVEIADHIEWKLQILAKVCPFDWKGLDEGVESTVSVRQPEVAPETDVSGGYIGG